jgi:hypothetical protein
VRRLTTIFLLLLSVPVAAADKLPESWGKLQPYFKPPAEYGGKLGNYRSPLLFEDGSPVRTAADWARRREEILRYWHGEMGVWPVLVVKPGVEILSRERRENFEQRRVKVQVAQKQILDGYVLVPEGKGPFPAVLVVYYDPETSIGVGAAKEPAQVKLRDFAYQLTKRGFVTLSIGSPGGDARKPDTSGNVLQPLSYLAYVAANCHTALAQMPEVNPKRIGVTGHSYGSKWAMFASCLYEKFAAAAWSDGGIVWDEAKPNVNYWEPWYLGLDSKLTRKPGVVMADNPRTGAYKSLIEQGHDLHELHALMAPRPFLVSGGSEDGPERWVPLNHTVAVNKLLSYENRVGMTNRKGHNPTEESNEQLYAFFEHFLK